MPYNSGKDICRVSQGQKERAWHYGNRIQALKYFLSIQKLGDKDIDDSKNFPDAKRFLTVIKTGSGPGRLWGGWWTKPLNVSTLHPH